MKGREGTQAAAVVTGLTGPQATDYLSWAVLRVDGEGMAPK